MMHSVSHYWEIREEKNLPGRRRMHGMGPGMTPLGVYLKNPKGKPWWFGKRFYNRVWHYSMENYGNRRSRPKK